MKKLIEITGEFIDKYKLYGYYALFLVLYLIYVSITIPLEIDTALWVHIVSLSPLVFFIGFVFLRAIIIKD